MLGLYWGYIRETLGLYWGYIEAILGSYWGEIATAQGCLEAITELGVAIIPVYP